MRRIDDKIIIAISIYIFLVSAVGAALPSETFTGAPSSIHQDQSDLIEAYNRTYIDSASPIKQLNWFQKILTVLFIPFVIDGIPVFLGVLIGFLNYMCAFLAGVYVYDKFRGIG